MQKGFDIRKTPATEIDRMIEDRITGGAAKLSCFDGEFYTGLFVLPKSTKEALRKEDRIITEDAPLVIP